MLINVQIFVDNIMRIHYDNLELEHFARHKGSEQTALGFSTMPITAFIYEFFIYNSLYSVNWEQSIQNDKIINFHNVREGDQQCKFVNYLKKMAESDLETFKSSFQELANEDIESKWTAVKPDSKTDGITLKSGEQFFNDLKALQSLVKTKKPFTKEKLGKVIPRVLACVRFVYEVRCNIFHGSKDMREITEDNQKKRIEIYYLFLNCLVSAFLHFIDKTIYPMHSAEMGENLTTSR